MSRHYTEAIAVGTLTGVALFASGKLLKSIGDKIGVPIGHGRIHSEKRERFIEEHPVASFLGAVPLVPIAEEVLWRYIPARLAEKYPARANSIKLGSAVLFAAQHSGPDALPVNHFLSGMAFEKMRERYGLSASITAHSVHNALASVDYIRQEKEAHYPSIETADE